MKINVIGVPMFYGCNINGVQDAPDILREYNVFSLLGVNGNEIIDLGNIYTNYSESKMIFENNQMKYQDEVVKINNQLADKVYNSHLEQAFPIIIGGDHSLALGSIAGSSKYFSEDLAVIWIDAHGDINTHKTSPSGRIHGMPLAASMGIGHESLTNIYYQGRKVEPSKVFILGVRDLDLGEIELIEKEKLNVWSKVDIDQQGLELILETVKNKIEVLGVNNIHLSFDIDSIDPTFMPGTGTSVNNGLSIKDAQYIIKTFIETGKVRSIDFVEFNPVIEKEKTLEGCKKIFCSIGMSLSKVS